MAKIKLHSFVQRGPKSGTMLFPHKHEDGMFVVSKTRFEKDYKRVSETAILGWLERGFALRMSNPKEGIQSPSLIVPGSIYRPVEF
jgi:hypothetical protein